MSEIRPVTLADLVAEDLRRKIVSRQLNEGDVLPSEAALAREYRVSPRAVRESIRILESEGFLQTQAGARHSARIAIPGPQAVSERARNYLVRCQATAGQLINAVVTMESAAIRLLASRSGAEAAAGMLSGTGPDQPCLGPDGSHAALLDASGNRAAGFIYSMLLHLEPSPAGAQPEARGADTHMKAASALAAGSVTKAQEIWTRHSQQVWERYLGGPEQHASAIRGRLLFAAAGEPVTADAPHST